MEPQPRLHTTPCGSFECLPDSYQLAPRPAPARIFCGCCRTVKDAGEVVHPVLGPICRWCSPAFKLDTGIYGEHRNVGEDLCPACAELGQPCERHDR